MVYLIGGSPRCGKTTFARRLAYQKRIPGVSTDLLRHAEKVYVPEAEWPVRFPQADWKTRPAIETLEAEIQESKTLWLGNRRFIGALLKHRQDYVIEGVHLLPELVQELSVPENADRLKVAYLVKTDLAQIVQGFEKVDKQADWLLRDVTTAEELRRAADVVRVKSFYFQNEAMKYGHQVVDTGADFEGSIERLLGEF